VPPSARRAQKLGRQEAAIRELRDENGRLQEEVARQAERLRELEAKFRANNSDEAPAPKPAEAKEPEAASPPPRTPSRQGSQNKSTRRTDAPEFVPKAAAPQSQTLQVSVPMPAPVTQPAAAVLEAAVPEAPEAPASEAVSETAPPLRDSKFFAVWPTAAPRFLSLFERRQDDPADR
jgi:uncharacterized coiled-coil protein SlyX